MKARTISINQIKGILVSAPEQVRSRFRALTSAQLISALERSRPVGNLTDPDNATALTLKKLAARYQFLEREILDTDKALAESLRNCAPLLRDVPGVGIEVASQLLVTVGDNPERIASEAQFAALVGVARNPA
ncbi:transposase [Cryobacterium sp. Y29]|uniref:transposase n=1 Tax=Cryobacterium sp. Y29 TaxID=2048285 RepID=UPI001E324244|nr:transposase [Cryobacterium sp. Y29]